MCQGYTQYLLHTCLRQREEAAAQLQGLLGRCGGHARVDNVEEADVHTGLFVGVGREDAIGMDKGGEGREEASTRSRSTQAQPGMHALCSASATCRRLASEAEGSRNGPMSTMGRDGVDVAVVERCCTRGGGRGRRRRSRRVAVLAMLRAPVSRIGVWGVGGDVMHL